jgi:hypothetical protein
MPEECKLYEITREPENYREQEHHRDIPKYI